ncbi:MAG: hypothetical protein ACE3NC_04005 [Candidatus Wallacebacter cryptica]
MSTTNFSHSDLKLVAAAPQTAATVIYYNGFGLESQMEVFSRQSAVFAVRLLSYQVVFGLSTSDFRKNRL